MHIINDGLSDPLYHAICKWHGSYTRTGYLSTTSCLKPPRQRVLEHRHDGKIMVNASSLIDMFIGTACHELIEKGDHPFAIMERELVTEVCGIVFSGRPDIILDRKIGDFKFGKASSFVFSGGLKEEYYWQGNINVWLARKNDLEADSAWVEYTFVDWSYYEAQRNSDYPQRRVVCLPIEYEGDVSVQRFVQERVELHLSADKLPDNDLPRCTDKEMWAKPDKWAVVRDGQKRAVKLFDEEVEAKRHAHGLAGTSVVKRPGERTRCERFCNAAQVCSQYREYLE